MELAQYFKTMNQQFLKMQKLAGLITESEYKKSLLPEIAEDPTPTEDTPLTPEEIYQELRN